MNIEINLIENDIKSFQKPIEEEMHKAIKHFEGELVKIRTGRAHTSLVESIPVSCYNQAAAPLKNFAALAAPEARIITIQPWDQSIIPDIEKAILNSDLGVTPRNDGKIIRIQLPELSSSRREDLVKILGKKCEDCKVAIRSIRKDFNNFIRDAKKDKDISENFFNRLSDVLKKVTDSYVEKVELMAKNKKEQITTI
ncbi:MAG: ribosome recycling factor [Candidatus Babeliales bacterium]